MMLHNSAEISAAQTGLMKHCMRLHSTWKKPKW